MPCGPPAPEPATHGVNDTRITVVRSGLPLPSPAPGELVIDKPGKGSFHGTAFGAELEARGITSLVVTGVTTEVCVHTTVREANDRGYECLVLSDCVGSYFPEFQRVGLAMIAAQGGIFGWVAPSEAFLSALVPQEVAS